MEGATDTGAAWRDRLDPRAFRAQRLFADQPGAARSRRPTDVVLLALSLVLLALTAWAADPPGPLSASISQFSAESPGWVTSGWILLLDLLAVWSVILVLLALVRRHVLLAVLATAGAALGVAIAYASHRVAVADALSLSDYLRVLTRSEGPPEFPAVRLAATSAVLVVMSPALSRPYRFFGRVLLVLGFLAGVGLDVTTFTGSIAAIAAGAAAAALVHLAAGSPGGRPSPDTVRSTLAQLGVDVRLIEPAAIQPASVALMEAVHADGRRLNVKVYGRDAWDGQLIAKFWRWAWYRDGRGKLLLSRLHQVEHEALMTVLAGRAGVNVPDIVTAGLAVDGDAALVSTAGGTPLGQPLVGDGHDELAPDDGIEHTLERLWTMIGAAHERGVVHGGIDLRQVTVDDDGEPMLVDWVAGSVAAPVTALHAERAQLLVLTALLVGAERAVSIAVGHLRPRALGDIVPYLQTPAMTTALRRQIRELDFDLDGLRDLAAERADVDQVELVKLRRVTIGSVLSMALLVFAAWLLVSALADVGVDTLVDELSEARWGWVVIALVVAQVARFWNAVGTTGATSQPLRLGPTTVLEFAITFVNLVVPSSAGRIATKMRFFQKAGMTLTAAAAMGVLDSVAGFVVQIVILLGALLFGIGGVQMDFDVNAASVERLAIMVVVIAAVLLVAFVVVTLLVHRVRDRVAMIWRQIRATLRVIRSPERMLRLFGGNFMAELTFAMVLGLCLRAYGGSAPLVSLLVVNVMVALLAGIMPVPGGIGVSEAALTAGLVAIGVPQTTAFATAITSRLCTYYLPPIWGYVAMRWLRKNQYL